MIEMHRSHTSYGHNLWKKRHNYSKLKDTDFSGAWEKLAEGASDNADQTAVEINPINVVLS